MHRHRHHGHQGGLRQLAAVEQVLAQHSGHQRHHHVVDLDAEVVLDLLDVGEVELGESHIAVCGDAGVERGARRTEGRRHRPAAGRPAHGFDHRGHRLRQDLGRQTDRAGDEPAQPAKSDPQRIHISTARHRNRRRRVGFDRTQLRHQVGTGDTVDGRVVHLRQDRHPATFAGVGSAETLDRPHLPQWVPTVQGQGRQVAADFGQLGPATRRGQADAVQVAFDVEVFVLHPHRVVEVQKAVSQFLPEGRNRRDAQRQFIAQTFEAVATRNGGRVQLQHRAHMQGLGGGFEVEEAGIEPAQPLQLTHDAMVSLTIPRRE